MVTATATRAKASTPVAPKSVGALIDAMYKLKQDKDKLEAEAKDISKQMSDLEELLTAKMDAEGVDKATGKLATVSFTHNVSAQAEGDEGWAQFYAFIKKTGYFHLLQRRVSDTAYRELLDAGKKVPGMQPFIKKRINLRKLA